MVPIHIDDDDDCDDDEDVTDHKSIRRIEPADTLGSIIPRVVMDVDRKGNDTSVFGRPGR